MRSIRGDQLGIGRVLADGDAADQILDSGHRRGAAEAVALAPADHALVGGDPHIDRLDMGARPAGEQRRLRPHVVRNAEVEGVDAFNVRRAWRFPRSVLCSTLPRHGRACPACGP